MPFHSRSSSGPIALPDDHSPSNKLTFFGMVAAVMAGLHLKEKWDECKLLHTLLFIRPPLIFTQIDGFLIPTWSRMIHSPLLQPTETSTRMVIQLICLLGQNKTSLIRSLPYLPDKRLNGRRITAVSAVVSSVYSQRSFSRY